ncbi:MAG: metal ABC transporter permease [Spirochaetaceae bacterium]|nr:metal ABC transporter permease [Spirochaetaceae bacterium]
MLDLLKELFSYTFIIRALVAGSLIALCSSLLGVSLVLKRYSMIGDGLSHVGFASLAIAMVLNVSPLIVSIPIAIVAAILLLRLSTNSSLKGDAAIALISSSALAIGILVTSLSSGLNTDVSSYMFGSILAMSKEDVIISIVLSIVVLFVFVFFYHKIFSVTFDETFAKASGLPANTYTLLIAICTAITVVIGMRLMGALMISSLIIFPSLTAMRLFKSFLQVIIATSCIALICFFVGMILSFTFSTPAGASIVVVNLIAFIIFSVIEKIQKH